MRVLSYNIHKGIGGRDRRYALQRVVDVIAGQDPDVVCLQEVDCDVPRSNNDDQPKRLSAALGLPHKAFQLNHKVRNGGYGNLTLSRWPIDNHADVSLKLNWRKRRAALVTRICTPEGDVKVVNQHLGLAENERRWQIRQLLAAPAMKEHTDLPTLIIGDFNDWRNQLHKRALAAKGFAQVTVPIREFRTFPAYMPLGALDKAFVRRFDVDSAMVVSDPPARDASDHLPIVLDLSPWPAE